MRKIILTNTEINYKDDSPDINIFNKEMLNEGFDKIKSFEVNSKGHQVRVNLVDGEIEIDGKLIDLEIDEKTKTKLTNLKWINFRRVKKSYRMSGNISKTTKYGIGFQGLIDGKNFKRFILLDREKIELNK